MAHVFIDPGHGGHDPGAVGNGLQEKERVLSLGLQLRDILQANGVKVTMSRTTDVFHSLSKRAEMANNAGADIFISLHLNASNGEGHGYETYALNANDAKTNKLHDLIHTGGWSYLSGKGFRNRGKKYANYAVLRLTRMPAILCETGFVDNAKDMSVLRHNEEQRKVAEGYAKGILSYFGKGLTTSPDTNPTPQPEPKPDGRATGPLGTATVRVSNLALRKGPGTGYEVIRRLGVGEPYVAYAIQDGWVNLGGDQWAFAGGGYMDLAIADNATYQNGGELGVGTVNVNVLNLRRSPNNGGELIRQLKKGEPYKVYAFKDGWYNLGGNQWAFGGNGYMTFTV